MDFTMFLPGEMDFVLEVLQSVSAIMATGYLGTGAAFGGVLALIIAGIKQLSSGAAIGWRTALLTIGMFQAFFATTQQVAVENMLTGETEIVDGIPTGVAVTGTIVTKTGWALTELMEQGFSRPGMTTNGLVL
ncbi:MAG: conjugal transfer protein TraG N-terminal domain-containing protein [Porticoccaceae bacterium]